jgi:diguanylate cyclase (GGDEF)-like protein
MATLPPRRTRRPDEQSADFRTRNLVPDDINLIERGDPFVTTGPYLSGISIPIGIVTHHPHRLLLILDLDRFKEVNETLGHQYGDELLRQVAQRACDTFRNSDTVARLSGDEFAVLLPDTNGPDAVALAERLITEIHRSFAIGNVTVDVEASVGVAVAADTDTSETLLRCADIAMCAAKDAKTGAVLYREEMHTEDSSRLLLLGDLRRALDVADQLALHYQPKVSLGSGGLCGVEALIRWQHPSRGMIAPADFIPIAETTGLINRLTSYVLRMAIGQSGAWLDNGLEVPVGVNLSPRCLLDPTLVTQVTDLLREFDLPPTSCGSR